jgi:hypothetical protein
MAEIRAVDHPVVLARISGFATKTEIEMALTISWPFFQSRTTAAAARGRGRRERQCHLRNGYSESMAARGTLFLERIDSTHLFTCQRTHRLERLHRPGRRGPVTDPAPAASCVRAEGNQAEAVQINRNTPVRTARVELKPGLVWRSPGEHRERPEPVANSFPGRAAHSCRHEPPHEPPAAKPPVVRRDAAARPQPR